MKVILTGSTGKVGGMVLSTCLANPSISSIVVLGRRNLPSELTQKHTGRLRNLILSPRDFLSFPSSVTAEIADADGCIWALGIPIGSREVELEFPVYALKMFCSHTVPKLKAQGKTFRFVFTSGALVNESQYLQKSMWFLEETRKAKSEAVATVLEIGKQTQALETYIVHPEMVLSVDGRMNWLFQSTGYYSNVDGLARAMVKLGTEDVDSVLKNTSVRNPELRNLGQ